MTSAALGLIGALILLQATWRTIGLRGAAMRTGLVRSSDPNLNAAAEASQDGLQREQLEELEVEHRFYKWGAAVLALGFVIQFLHELAHYLQH